MADKKHWENQFSSLTQASNLYIGTQENRAKLLDLRLDLKKAELAERKIEDREFCSSTAKSFHPHNFLARWTMALRLRIRHHNHRKDLLNEFKAEQKAERDEIAGNIKTAKADYAKMKKEYGKAYKAGDETWIQANKGVVTDITKDIRDARAANIISFNEIKDQIDENKRYEAEALKNETERVLKYDNSEASYYDLTPPDLPKPKDPIPERKQLDISVNKLEQQIMPNRGKSAHLAKDDPQRQTITQDPPSLG